MTAAKQTFPAVANWPRRAVAVYLLVLLIPSACSSTTNTNTDPAAGAVNTGTFPNLNIAPTPAAAPISAGEKASLQGQLAAAKGSLAAAGKAAAPTNPLLLKKIADEHAEAALKKIEGR